MTEPCNLILLRHGQSKWNQENIFAGWVDVPLTDTGRAEAKRAGELLVESGNLPDIVYTSVLTRAVQTGNLALGAADRLWIQVKRSWRLNERHYGVLQGKDKAQTLEEFGPEQFLLWRRSYAVPPLPLPDDSEYSQAKDIRYAGLGRSLPRTEALEHVVGRMLPYWDSEIKRDLAASRTVLIVSHGKTLRALVKYLEGISDEDIVGLNVPTGIPLVYRLDKDFVPLRRGEYLDPEGAAAAGAAMVAAQGIRE